MDAAAVFAGPVDRLRALPGFMRGVWRRLTWRVAAVSAIAALVIWPAATMTMPGPHGPRPAILGTAPQDWLSIVIVLGSTALSAVLPILAADEAVERGARRAPAYLLAVLVGTAVGALAQYLLHGAFGVGHAALAGRWEFNAAQPLSVFATMLLFTGVVTLAYATLRSSFAATRLAHAAGIVRAHARRAALESQLRAMQSRIEPNFLFDALAQVGTLYESDPERAGQALDRLIDYLRLSLPRLRAASSTLREEVELARSCLGVRTLVLGQRIAHEFDVPEAIAGARIPPMLILPLIDLAIGPRIGPTGCAVSIKAAMTRDHLTLSVVCRGRAGTVDADAAEAKAIEERVRELYDERGGFRIGPAPAGEARAVLEIPHETPDRRHR